MPEQPNSPWGNKGSNQQPPDLDEVIKRVQEKFSKYFGGSSNGDGGGSGLGIGKGALPVVLGIIFVGWVVSGFYVVAADEQAVVLRFGKHVDTTGPGLHWRLPTPLEEDIRIPVTRVQRVEIGYRSMPGGDIRKVTNEAQMLTMDENIVAISFTVQYTIKDISDYLFNIAQGPKTVKDAAEAAIREIIGRTTIDAVITSEKARVETETQFLIQEILDGYGAGISIRTVKLQDVQPPERVIREFKDVASAREDRERAKNEAQAYANDIIPKARGQAKQEILGAEAYQISVTKRARGEAERFVDRMRAYQAAPEVTEQRLYIETMQKVLAASDKIIIDANIADKVLPYLPLDKASRMGVK